MPEPQKPVMLQGFFLSLGLGLGAVVLALAASLTKQPLAIVGLLLLYFVALVGLWIYWRGQADEAVAGRARLLGVALLWLIGSFVAFPLFAFGICAAILFGTGGF